MKNAFEILSEMVAAAAFLFLIAVALILAVKVSAKIMEKVEPIEQNWIEEGVVCYMQGKRAINCEMVRTYE